MRDLTTRQSVFVSEMLKTKNPIAAALAAGYSGLTAQKAGEKLLGNPKIKQALNAKLEAVSERAELTAERVIEEARRLLVSDVGELFDAETGAMRKVSDLSPEVRATIASIEVEELFDGTGDERKMIGYVKKVKLWDKGKALDLLMRHFDLLAATKVEHKHDVQVQIANLSHQERLERAQTIALKAIALVEDSDNG